MKLVEFELAYYSDKLYINPIHVVSVAVYNGAVHITILDDAQNPYVVRGTLEEVVRKLS